MFCNLKKNFNFPVSVSFLFFGTESSFLITSYKAYITNLCVVFHDNRQKAAYNMMLKLFLNIHILINTPLFSQKLSRKILSIKRTTLEIM